MATTHLRTAEGRTIGKTERKGRTLEAVLLHFRLIIGFLILGIILVSVLYLAEFNHLATQGVIIDQLETKRIRLITENEVWRMKISQLSSLDVITQQEVVLQMPTIEDVKYVE